MQLNLLPSSHLVLAPRSSQFCQQRKCCIARSAGSEDPYKVLGIPKNADSNQIARVYRKKIAEAKGNEAETSRIEKAHTSIMMAGLSSRLSGGVKVDKDIAFADKAVFFPWRPRVSVADRKLLTIAAVGHGLLAAWAVFLRTTAGNQPIIASVVLGAGIGSWKLNQIFPSPPSGSEAASKSKQGMKNIIRGVGLAMFATFVGCFLTFTAPDQIAAQMGKVLPYWFYESETVLISLGTAIGNFTANALYR